MITLEEYWQGRDKQYSLQLGTDIRHNAAITVEAANKLLVLAKTSGVSLEASPRTGSLVSSGWRPAGYNQTVPGAALRSKHIFGQAIDLYDPDGDLDEWCLANADTVLKDVGLWLEHPSATKGWCHLQIIPPNSKRRVFYP